MVDVDTERLKAQVDRLQRANDSHLAALEQAGTAARKLRADVDRYSSELAGCYGLLAAMQRDDVPADLRAEAARLLEGPADV